MLIPYLKTKKNGRDLPLVFNDQDNGFDNYKLTALDSITANRNPTSDNELANKKVSGDIFGENTVFKFNQNLPKYL